MLGSDPISALLGAGLDVRSPQVVWKNYLSQLAEYGCAVRMLGPDVMAVPGLSDEHRILLSELTAKYPVGQQMPVEDKGSLRGLTPVDLTPERISARVAAYFRRIVRVVGKELAPSLLDAGAITASAGVHIGYSNLVAVHVPTGEALTQWRSWAAQTSGDPHEAHTAPTLLLPGLPGGGIYLFRTPATGAPFNTRPAFASLENRRLQVGDCVVDTGDMTVPIPPSRMYGHPLMRLGPCRALPQWLEVVVRQCGVPVALVPQPDAITA